MRIRSVKINKKVMGVLTRVQKVLEGRDIEGYLTGGSVRDAMMGRVSEDLDIVVGAPALDAARDIANALNGKFIPLDEVNGVARVVLAEGGFPYLDVATIQGSIADDLALRDFTIDAMAINLKDLVVQVPTVVDPYGGRQDLNARVVRSISEESFKRDPLRLLRGPRLAAECGFTLDDQTAGQIARHHSLITQAAAERVREELCRLLSVPKADRWLRLLDDLRLLMDIFPELSACRGAEQPKEHYWDVLDHSVESVGTVEFLLRMSGSGYFGSDILEVAPWSVELQEHFDEVVGGGHQRKTLLKLAALLHDIAKPQTKIFEEDGRMRFFGHSQEGAVVTRGIMERLRFSSSECEIVSKVIEHHLRPGQLAREGELPTQRAIYRYFRDTGDVGIDAIFLNLADHLAARGPMLVFEKWREHAEIMSYVIDKKLREESVVSPPKLVSGYDLINNFGMVPGPEIGRLLEMVREAQAAGEVTTREEALLFVKGYLPQIT
jgi:poly(A) polymerase